MARRYYNGAVRNLNILVESFPVQPRRQAVRLPQARVFRARQRRPIAPCPTVALQAARCALSRSLRRVARGLSRWSCSRPRLCPVRRAPRKSSSRFDSIVACANDGALDGHRDHPRQCRGQRHPARHLPRLSADVRAMTAARCATSTFECCSASTRDGRPSRIPRDRTIGDGIRIYIGDAGHAPVAPATTPTSSATDRTGRSAGFADMPSSTGTSPAITGASRSRAASCGSTLPDGAGTAALDRLYRPRSARRGTDWRGASTDDGRLTRHDHARRSRRARG